MIKRIISFFSVFLFLAMSVQAEEKPAENRLDEVAKRGAQVMPFSLERTLHIFTKTAAGGVQQVVVKNEGDAPQIKLIREHLSKISGEFSRGDFSNPARIHGEHMPGLAALRAAGPGLIKIEYKDLPKGAEITYRSNDPALIKAIHDWFDAQLSDHARHAVPGHPHHPRHHAP
jgi:hypothetical protein